MTSVPPHAPPINFSLPESLQVAVHELRERLVEVLALAGAVAEKLSAIPGLPREAQALANLNEQAAGTSVADMDRLCAALDALAT